MLCLLIFLYFLCNLYFPGNSQSIKGGPSSDVTWSACSAAARCTGTSWWRGAALEASTSAFSSHVWHGDGDERVLGDGGIVEGEGEVVGVAVVEDLVAGESVLFQRGILGWGRRHFQLAKGCRISVRSYLAGQPLQLLVNLNNEILENVCTGLGCSCGAEILMLKVGKAS
jgi:hypothetical protein